MRISSCSYVKMVFLAVCVTRTTVGIALVVGIVIIPLVLGQSMTMGKVFARSVPSLLVGNVISLGANNVFSIQQRWIANQGVKIAKPLFPSTLENVDCNKMIRKKQKSMVGKTLLEKSI